MTSLAFDEPTTFVNNEWSNGGGEAIPVSNPADGSVIARVASATDEQVSAAIGAAWDARRAWARLPAVERSAYVRRMARVVEQHRDELERLLVQEVGKPLAQARGELDFTIGYFDYTAEWDRRIEGDILPSDNAGESIHLVRSPLGVVAAICPWNFPLALFARKVAPALVTGNTVVLKPSEVTPLSTVALMRLIDEHVGLPAGVLNLVAGGKQTGATLVDDPRVAMISMTGHRDTGKAIMARAAKNLTRVSLELGGKAPLIVWSDADIPAAVEAGIVARHGNAGQICTCAERVYVHEAVADEFVERYVEAARNLRMGDPMTDVDLGPLVNDVQFEKAQASMARAVDEGATVTLAGGRPSGGAFARGYWYAPAVLTGVNGDMSIMREETFAPITPIQRVSSLDEVFDEANRSRYGLSAYLFTNDYRVVMRAANELECGELYVNRANGEALQAHHIGHKESGIGGEDGKYGILKYTQLRSVYHRYGA